MRRPSSSPRSFTGTLLAVAAPALLEPERVVTRALLAASDGALVRACKDALVAALEQGRASVRVRTRGNTHVVLEYAADDAPRTRTLDARAPEVHAAVTALRTGAPRMRAVFARALRAHLGRECVVAYDVDTHTIELDWTRAAAATAAAAATRLAWTTSAWAASSSHRMLPLPPPTTAV
jgi:hypothetical protein